MTTHVDVMVYSKFKSKNLAQCLGKRDNHICLNQSLNTINASIFHKESTVLKIM